MYNVPQSDSTRTGDYTMSKRCNYYIYTYYIRTCTHLCDCIIIIYRFSRTFARRDGIPGTAARGADRGTNSRRPPKSNNCARVKVIYLHAGRERARLAFNAFSECARSSRVGKRKTVSLQVFIELRARVASRVRRVNTSAREKTYFNFTYRPYNTCQ